MRIGVLLVGLGMVGAVIDANAQPAATPPEPTPSPSAAIEVAGTWSGNTAEPETGWRAAVLMRISDRVTSSGARMNVAVIARYDEHGAPAEGGWAETHATSWGGGLRATTIWPSGDLRFGAFAEGTIGATRARHADEMTTQRDRHWMVSGGMLLGTRTFQIVADFGWLVTDVGDGRIGPIASLGLHFALD